MTNVSGSHDTPVKCKSRKALLLSAYDAGSHRQWRSCLLTMFPHIDWTVLTLPPRYFAWRIRGNSLSWAFNHRATLTDNYDFVLATSMTDLSALRGFVPSLASIPTAVYFHENQFAYPANQQVLGGVEPQILNLYTALCADVVVFNSAWNRDSFLRGVAALLKKLPDHVPAGLMQRLEQAEVIPVPLGDECIIARDRDSSSRQDSILTLVWNHRWEYDKGPVLLLAVVRQLCASSLPFRMHLLGERFRSAPVEFAEICNLLQSHYERLGISPGVMEYLPDREYYLKTLRHSDVVLSTADHDFQGLSVLEASACGCTPLAPARLVYPEYLTEEFLYSASLDLREAAASVCEHVEHYISLKQQGIALPKFKSNQFSQSKLSSAYANLFERLLK